MAVNHKALKDALKIMCEAPDSIRRAEDRYKEKLAAIAEKERGGNWSPNAIAADRKTAREDRDRVVGRLMGQMKDAIYTVNDNNSFEGESFDFADQRFQSALNFLNLMGHDMTPRDQINLLENFRGNPGALNALGAAMKKSKLYFADHAKEMTKTIPQQALEDAAFVVGKYDLTGEVDLSRMRWTGREFKKQAERMGYDMTDAPNPYVSALMDARDLIPVSDDPKEQAKNDAARWKIDAAIKELKTGQGSPEDILSKAIKGIDDLAAQGAESNAE